MTDKLKPCPFCGSDDVHIKVFDDFATAVECNFCETTGPTAYLEENAIDGWNRRENND